jgi:NTE family protein
MLYVLTLMLRHQSVGVLPLLLGYKHTVLYLPTPCPLPIAPHDFTQGARLIESGYATARTFLEELRLEGPGIYGHPHFHSAADVPGKGIAVQDATAVDAIAAALASR